MGGRILVVGMVLLGILWVGCVSSDNTPKIIVGIRYSENQIENIAVTDKTAAPPLQMIGNGNLKVTVQSTNRLYASGSAAKFWDTGYQTFVLKLNPAPTKGDLLEIKAELLQDGKTVNTRSSFYEWQG